MNTLKKISFGAFAFIFGLTLVLTQSAFKNGPMVATKAVTTLYYHNASYALSDVTTESNWNTTPPESPCIQRDQQACSVTINSTYVDFTPAVPVLKSSATLTAALSSGTAYVTGSADNTMAIINTERP
jgi:hypothetical protein